MIDVIKQSLSGGDLTIWAEFGLALFFCAFVGVSVRVLLTDRGEARAHAERILSDGHEVPHD